MNAANVILQQLGNGRFATMTGAKNFAHSNEGKTLAFKLPSNFAKQGINYVTITLDASDTYSMIFGKIRGVNYKELATKEGVYADNLQSVFTEVTGLDTHL